MTRLFPCLRSQKPRRSLAVGVDAEWNIRWWIPRLAGLLLIPLLSLGTILAQTPHPHREHKRDYRREILAIEEQWRKAQLAGDFDAMDRLLADDYFGISMSGQPNDKMQQIERMRDRTFILNRIDLSDVKIKVEGRVAIVTSKAHIEGRNEGASITGTYRYTRIYRRYPDTSWKITNFEVTRAP